MAMAAASLLHDKTGYATFDGDGTPPQSPVSSYSNASWLSRFVFGYARGVLDVGRERQLEMDDQWELEGDTRTRTAYAKYKAQYIKQDKPVVLAMFAAFGGQILLCGIGSTIMAACVVFTPVVLHHLIGAFSTPGVDLHSLALRVGACFVSRLVNAFTGAHVNFRLEMVMLQLTVSLKSLIFEKTLRRSIQSKTTDNDSVDVSNLFTSDVDNMLLAGYQLNSLWIMAIQISVVMYILYNVLDVAAFAGLALIFLSIFLNDFVAKGYINSYEAIMEFKDGRMKAIKERSRSPS